VVDQERKGMTDEPRDTFEEEEREEEDEDVEAHYWLKNAPEDDDGERVGQYKIR
jgi:hypothetical protein